MREAIVSVFDWRHPGSARSAPVDVRIEQSWNQIASADVVDNRGLGQRHTIVVKSDLGDAMVFDDHAGLDHAASEPVEHGGAADHAQLATRRTRIDGPRAGQLVHPKRRRRERRHTQGGPEDDGDGRQRSTWDRLGVLPAEQQRCEHGARNAHANQHRERAENRNQGIAANDHAGIGVDQIGRREQARKSLDAIGQDRKRNRRSRQEHQWKEQQIGNCGCRLDVVCRTANEQPERDQRAGAAHEHDHQRRPRARRPHIEDQPRKHQQRSEREQSGDERRDRVRYCHRHSRNRRHAQSPQQSALALLNERQCEPEQRSRQKRRRQQSRQHHRRDAAIAARHHESKQQQEADRKRGDPEQRGLGSANRDQLSTGDGERTTQKHGDRP